MRCFEDLPLGEQQRIKDFRGEAFLAVGGRLLAIAATNAVAVDSQGSPSTLGKTRGLVALGGILTDLALFKQVHSSYFEGRERFPFSMAAVAAGLGGIASYEAQKSIEQFATTSEAAFWGSLTPVLPLLTFVATCDTACVRGIPFMDVDPGDALISLKDVIRQFFQTPEGDAKSIE